MANTKRRIIDRSGNMFLPMNMEGNNYTDSFWQTPKLVIGGTMMFLLLAILLQPVVGNAQASQVIKLVLIWLFFMFFITRYIIFEEKFNYKMYKQMLQYEVSTPALFWDIVQIKNTGDGAILTYRDGKTAVLLKVERDTITGKPKEFKETHFDAIQDFYNRLQDYKLSFVQMNIMEPAGNDPRLSELDKLVTKSDNPNIQKLMQLQVGYTKRITKKTLYESDLFLIYVKDRTRVDTIINDVEDCVLELLAGAYIGYRILDENDILDFVKDQYGVSYFNRTEATLSLFSRTNQTTKPTFSIAKVVDQNGREFNIQKEQANRIHRMTIENEKGNFDSSKLSVKRDIINKDPAYKDRITFQELAGTEFSADRSRDTVDEETRFHMRKDVTKREPSKSKVVLGKSIQNAEFPESGVNQSNIQARAPKNNRVLKKSLVKGSEDSKSKQLESASLDFDDTIELDEPDYNTEQINQYTNNQVVETIDDEFGEQTDSSNAEWDSFYDQSNTDDNSDEELQF